MSIKPDIIPPRHEHKFLVTHDVAMALRRRLVSFSTLDTNSLSSPDHRYLITSLYYDSPQLSFFEDTRAGVRKRFKLRVRRYGEKLGDSPVFFEVKERVGDIIVKRRAFVPPVRWHRRLVDDHEEAGEAERDFRARMRLHDARPTLLVRYAREAWKGEIDHYVRVTFDTRLAFAAVDDASLDTDRIWEAADDAVAFDESDSLTLVEVKFERTVPRWLASAIQELGLERRGFSKYGTGIRRTFGVDSALDVARRIPRY